MKEADRNRIEKRLLEERERTQRSLEQMDESTRISTEDDGELTQYDQHPADDGTDTMEQEKALMLLGRETDMLEEINEALRRLYGDEETFGQCENCGREIALERLDVVPWARLCSDCATQAEKSAQASTEESGGAIGESPRGAGGVGGPSNG